jgi:hypothetical protein
MNDRSVRRFRVWCLLVPVGVGLAAVVAATLQAPVEAQQTLLAQAPQVLESPPEGQTYVGARNCASCHFDQFLDWRQTKHSKAFDVLPARYKTDATCLKCHATGFGEPNGFKSLAATPDLVAASCESCHGPGSKHAEIAKSFGSKKLNEAESTYVRSTIHLMQPKNVCVDCHLTRAHKKHPDYVK